MGENILAAKASNQGAVEVLFNNKAVTNDVRENGPGIYLDDNEYITIRFPTEQTIDSVVILSNSNVQSYAISYIKSNGDEYILEEVISIFELIESIFSSVRLESEQFRNKIQSNSNNNN